MCTNFQWNKVEYDMNDTSYKDNTDRGHYPIDDN